jgi:hypothetical protein
MWLEPRLLTGGIEVRCLVGGPIRARREGARSALQAVSMGSVTPRVHQFDRQCKVARAARLSTVAYGIQVPGRSPDQIPAPVAKQQTHCVQTAATVKVMQVQFLPGAPVSMWSEGEVVEPARCDRAVTGASPVAPTNQRSRGRAAQGNRLQSGNTAGANPAESSKIQRVA